MNNIEENSEKNTTLHRGALFHGAGESWVHIGIVALERTAEAKLQFQLNAHEEARALLEDLTAAAKLALAIPNPASNQPSTTSAPDDANAGEVWSTFLAELAARGFELEALPNSDMQVKLHIDMVSGRAIGTHGALHPYATDDSERGRKIANALMGAVRRPAVSLAQRVRDAVATGDASAAAKAVKENTTALTFGFNEELFDALMMVDATAIAADERLDFRWTRILVASQGHREERVIADVEACLGAHDKQLSEDQRLNLRMLFAICAGKTGRNETARTILNEILNAPTPISAIDRAWAYRNLSMTFPRESQESQRYSQLSADAFLEAGDRDKAVGSLLGLFEGILFQNPDGALSIIDELIGWYNGDDASDRDKRAGLLHIRANAKLSLQKHEEALRDAKEASHLREGLLCAEPQLISSLHLASIAATKVGLTDDAAHYRSAAMSLTALTRDPDSDFAERAIALMEAFDLQVADDLLKEAGSKDDLKSQAFILSAMATHNPTLNLARRIELLERAIELLEQAQRRGQRIESADFGPIHLAVAIQLADANELERALPWYAKALETEPLDPFAVNEYVRILWKLEKWRDLATFVDDQIRKFGEFPDRLYVCGRALLNAGQGDKALSYLVKAKKLAQPGNKIHEFAQKYIDEALEAGAKLPESNHSEGKIVAPITRAEFEKCLERFARHVQSDHRMRFWKSSADCHKWVDNPERLAQSLLHTFLKAAFDDRIEIFEEVAVGAGRMDLYMSLRGGLRVILELKMCGAPSYSSSYAFEGAEQIVHYMENKGTSLGYLVIFDGRRQDFGQGLKPVERIGKHTVMVQFADVRPDVKATTKKAKKRAGSGGASS